MTAFKFKPPPILTLLAAAGTLLAAASCRRKTAPAAANSAAATPVETGALQRTLFVQRLQVQGAVAPVLHADIAARVPGVLDRIFVKESQRVKTGTPLFQTDQVTLENAVQAREHELAVAKASVAEAKAGLAQKQALLDKARVDYLRFKELFEKHRAVTRDAFEKTRTAWKEAEAGVVYANALIQLAEARCGQAESALRIAQKQLADSLVKAPFPGVVTLKIKEQGEYAGPGVPVLRLESTGKVECSAFIDAANYARIIPGKTEVRIRPAEDQGPALSAVITYKAAAVNPITRTFEIKARLHENTPLVPGMPVNIEVVLSRRRAFGLPEHALVHRNQTDAVFVVQNHHARLHPVQTGMRDHGWIEILNSQTLTKARIVLQGQAFLNDGDPVRIVSDKPEPQ